jgi:predicted membrane channel-forming protein YqfA (hemolysin III family)
MHKDCSSNTETDSLFCEPYIHSGFRPAHKPYSYYIKSLFMKHNETINAWSHYIGALYTISLLFRYDLSDPYSWPILTGILTATIMFFTSASAHLMHSKNTKCHMNCFLCDFAGISFNVFGACFMQIYICSPIYYFNWIKPVLLPIIGGLSLLCCLLNSLSQTVYHRPYPKLKRVMQFGPCAFSYLFALFPLILQMFFNSNEQFKINFTFHLLSLTSLIVGAVCFALDFPQRFLPGKFDFIGQGHHFFHLCIFLVEMFQLNACYSDYLMNRDLIANSRQPPTFAYCFVSLFIITLCYVYVIRMFSTMVSHNFDNDGNFKNETTQFDNNINVEKNIENEILTN